MPSYTPMCHPGHMHQYIITLGEKQPMAAYIYQTKQVLCKNISIVEKPASFDVLIFHRVAINNYCSSVVRHSLFWGVILAPDCLGMT